MEREMHGHIAMYTVPSRSQPNTKYDIEIDLDLGHVSCGCPSFQYRLQPEAHREDIEVDIGQVRWHCPHIEMCIADCIERGEILLSVPQYKGIDMAKDVQELLPGTGAEPAKWASGYVAHLAPPAPTFNETMQKSKDEYHALIQFKNEFMVEGEHYGNIPGVDKPVLFKGGAEVLGKAMGLTPTFTFIGHHYDLAAGIVAYEIVCHLHGHSSASPIEGVGSCSNGERRYARQSAADVANTVLKMAKKRAHVDAVLTATGASCIFTQDMEDANDEKVQGTGAHQVAESATSRGTRAPGAVARVNGAIDKAKSERPAPAGDVPPCNVCGGEMWDNRATKKTANHPDFACKQKKGACLNDRGYPNAQWVEKNDGKSALFPAAEKPDPLYHSDEVVADEFEDTDPFAND